MKAAIRHTISLVGWILLLACLAGLGRGAADCAASDYLANGSITLALRTVASQTNTAMAWGILISIALGLVNLAIRPLLPTRPWRAACWMLFFLYVLFFAAMAFIHAAVAYESHIPADYRDQVTLGVMINSLLLPMLSEAVTGFNTAFLSTAFGLLLIGIAIAVLPVFGVQRLVRTLRKQKPAAIKAEAGLRLWPAIAGAALWLVAAVMPLLAGASPPADAYPVILVSIDTLRTDHLGCYGYDKAKTPVLDNLAGEGIVFEQAVSLSPWTLASHVTMLSGQNPIAHGVTSIKLSIPQRTYLVQELYANAGYSTGAAVTNFLLSPDYGFDQGFDSYTYLPEKRGEWAAAAARKFIDDNFDEPFFYFLHLYDPHYPYEAPLFYKDLFWKNRSMPLDFPESFPEFARQHLEMSPEQLEYVIANYDAEIAYSDQVVGQVITELKRLDLYDEALIVITSDHGEEFLDHGFLGHSVTLYEEVLHVPLIVKLPQGRHAGLRVQGQVRVSDIPVFLAARAGLEFPGAHEGIDFSPMLSDSEIDETGPALGFTDLFGPARYSRRSEAWKWISESSFTYGQYEMTSEERIFNLAQDPGEQINLAGSMPDRAAELAAEAVAEIEAVKLMASRMGTPDSLSGIDPATSERLKSLGYLQ